MQTLMGTLLMFFFINSLFVNGQNKDYSSITIKGQVVDQKTLKPIPYSNIVLLQTTIGTVTNEEGNFLLTIPNQCEACKLQISCIGYKTRAVDIKSKESLRILLTEDALLLNAITIIADDNSAMALVKRAFNNIPNNYTNHAERLEGYFQETLAKDTALMKPYYLIEGALEVDKEPYTTHTKHGNVKLVKGRRFIAGSLDSVDTRIVGGAHNPHRFDFVLRREAPLNKQNLKNYNYRIVDSVYYDGHEIVIIFFTPNARSANGRGKLYIATDTYAIIKGEFDFNEHETNFFETGLAKLNSSKRLYLRYKTEYFYQDSSWRLKYAEYHTAFRLKNRDTIYLKNAFITTKFQTIKEQIPYVERIQFNNILLDVAKDNDDEFWNQYNVVNSSELQRRMEQAKLDKPKTKPPSVLRKKFLIRSKFRVNFSAFVYETTVSDLNISLNSPTLQIDTDINSRDCIFTGYSASVQYEVSKNFIMGFESASSFAKKTYSRNCLEFAYEKNLRPEKRPVYISPSLKIGYGKQRIFLSNLDNSQDVVINEKSFDSKSISSFFESRGYFIIPNFSLLFERSHRMRYFINAEYNFYLESNYGLYFLENESILTRKNTFIESGTNGLVIKSSSTSSFTNGLNFSFGIALTF